MPGRRSSHANGGKAYKKSYSTTIAGPPSASDSGWRLLFGIVAPDLTQITVGIRFWMEDLSLPRAGLTETLT